MKKIIFLVLIGLSVWNCSNDDDPSNSKLLGNWHWIGSSGGIAGTTETPELTGNEIRLEITNDSIKRYINNTLIFKSKYHIETKESFIFNEKRKMMITENEFAQIIEFNGKNLILIGDCNDCYTSEYQKE